MDVGAYLKFILALVFVLALIVLLAYLAKRFGLMARVTLPSDMARTKRLNIVEILPVDAKRKLLLIRRDEQEHLIMLGSEHDLVIEQNIKPPDHETGKGYEINK